MLGIGRRQEEVSNSPRVSAKRRHEVLEQSSPPFNNGFLHRSFFSYHKLPKQLLIKLCILKLDGSSFDIHVASNAVVAVLKQEIEGFFSSTIAEGQGQISWPHVWGHFCLCFKDQKLTNDKACIRNYGINDGDQLQFVHHLSINENKPIKRQIKCQRATCKQNLRLSSGLSAEPKEERTGAYHEDTVKQFSYKTGSDDPMPPPSKLARFFNGCLSYSKLQKVSEEGSNDMCE